MNIPALIGLVVDIVGWGWHTKASSDASNLGKDLALSHSGRTGFRAMM
jgi:hypothetical protein